MDNDPAWHTVPPMTASTPISDSPVTVTRIPDPGEPKPAVAIPTMILFATGLIIWAAAIALGLGGVWSDWWSVIPAALGAYLLFTVTHDAVHHSVSTNERLNDFVGTVATPIWAATLAFKCFRYTHSQHHRFTNHQDGRDPDRWTMTGPAWQLPFRWATVDVAHVAYYLRHINTRSWREWRDQLLQIGLLTAAIVAAVATGHVSELVLLWLLPARITFFLIGFLFDYLPHNACHATPSESKYRTTTIRLGGERIVSPMMLYQNYHLVHHMHPRVPFYRYVRVWLRNEKHYVDNDAAMTSLRGREITADEYRALRAIANQNHS
jgi:fatty acid desaturase